ncbi:MAG: hypothetical protein KC418_11675 [Anaerolineales bacterium]|nr:hypothetical protein [Anaerolineales bacterium]MCB8950739.1 hypothetical protein [Ardenticatenales bacterium]
MSEAAFPLKSMNSESYAAGADRNAVETTPGHDEEVRWVVIQETGGILPAQVIAGSLQAEGIPAIAWQEGAGRAIGLTVGLLGNGYVSVPQNYEQQARDFLAMMDDLEEEWEEEDWDDEENETP